ncbi:MAG: hypothetical protein LUE14_04330 [Clostridiales bacterium]|nr:hypothetical protein [Clostridiales bacterium]
MLQKGNPMHFRKSIAVVMAAAVISAAPLSAIAATSSEIQKEINSFQSELEESRETSASLEAQIAVAQAQAGELYAEIEALRIQKEEYISSMGDRIAYFYESESGYSVLSALLGAGSFADLLDVLVQQQALHEYDSDQMDQYEALVAELEEKEAELDTQIEALGDMVEEQAARQAVLEASISEKETELAKAREAEAAKRACADPVTYAMSSSGGVLTKSKGVVYFNGHRETYYSQRVLPGNGLNIPGRHVEASDGTVRDIDNYICVASSDLAKGTVVETSLGTGKVYDCGCASGTIDIYVDW